MGKKGSIIYFNELQSQNDFNQSTKITNPFYNESENNDFNRNMNPVLEIKKSMKKKLKKIEADYLGIILYFAGWLTIGMWFTFSTNKTIKHILDFYRTYDIFALAFVILHFTYTHAKFKDEVADIKELHNIDIEFKDYGFRFKEFKIKDLFRGFFYIFLVCLPILILINVVLYSLYGFTSPEGGQTISGQMEIINEYNINTHVILQISRFILTEELVFRGFALLLPYIVFKEIFKQSEKISNIFAIILSSLLFGLVHIFRYGYNLHAILFLIFLGLMCAVLAVKEGLWAAILLHIVNNMVSIFGGQYRDFGIKFDTVAITVIMILCISVITILLLVSKISDDLFIFSYFGAFLILFFIIGFYSNGMVKSEDFNGAYFEHFHIILFVPGIILLFRNKMKNGKLFSILIGMCIGLFISDYFDILNLTNHEIGLTIIYLIVAIPLYAIIYKMIEKIEKNTNKWSYQA